jgi:hypothetical protein
VQYDVSPLCHGLFPDLYHCMRSKLNGNALNQAIERDPFKFFRCPPWKGQSIILMLPSLSIYLSTCIVWLSLHISRVVETFPRCHDYRMRCSIKGATLLYRVMSRWLTLESQSLCLYTPKQGCLGDIVYRRSSDYSLIL